MTAASSRWIAVAALVGLAALVLRDGVTAAAIIAAGPLIVLVAAAVTALPRWAIASAILMLPYFCYAVMETLTAPDARAGAILYAGLTLVVFFAALDSLRRTRAPNARTAR